MPSTLRVLSGKQRHQQRQLQVSHQTYVALEQAVCHVASETPVVTILVPCAGYQRSLDIHLDEQVRASRTASTALMATFVNTLGPWPQPQP
jgi:hypothetical protein